MFQNFRQAMAWVHTWFGLVLGFVLMACFFFGALSVFDREIDRWAIPASRLAPQPMPSFDTLLRPVFDGIGPEAASIERMQRELGRPLPESFDTVRSWQAYTTHRDPVLELFASYLVPDGDDPDLAVWGNRTIDPRTGSALSGDRLRIGSRFFYPLHYSLNLHWKNLGSWIVGFAGMTMLAALVSGVVLHRRIFREFFTFRRHRSSQRSVLDLHNLSGVLALPFHFFFALTGLVIFAGIYFPVADTQLAPLHRLNERLEALNTGLPRVRAGVPAPLASVDAMMDVAQQRWAARGMAGEVGLLVVWHVGDANSYVSLYRAGTDRIALVGDGIHFKSSTGELLHEDPPPTAIDGLNTFLTGLHLQHFRHWLLRWFYLLGGLMGCVCIATGFVFFVQRRKERHAKAGGQAARIVDALAVTAVTGMLIATLTILVATRLLPEALPIDWLPRGDLEQYLFWSGWGLAMIHAFVRGAPVAQGRMNPAWVEQCRVVAGMALAAVLLNGIATGDHLVRTLITAPYWPVAGVDLFLLAVAMLAVAAARALKSRMAAQRQAPPAVAAAPR